MRIGIGTSIVGQQIVGGGVQYLDEVGGTPTAAYSVDKVVSTYTDAVVEVRRTVSAVTVEADVAFDGDTITLDSAVTITSGSSSATTLGEFVANASYSDPDSLGSPQDAFVATWYDQAGSNDATQTTAADQPKIVNAGALVTENGKVALDFDGTSDCLITSQNNPFSFTGGISLIHTSYKNSTAYKDYETILSAGTTGNTNFNLQKSIAFGYGNSANHSPIPTISTDIWQPSGIQYDGTVSTDESRIVGFYISNWSTHRSTGFSALRSNGSDLTTKSYGTFDPASLNSNPIKIGVFDQVLSDSFFAGKIHEVIAYNSDKSALRTAIEANINSRFSIYP